MFKAIKEFFFGKPQAAAPEAPYKVETPAFKPTADAAPAAAEVVTPVAPVKAVRKPRANVAAKKPAARKPAAPKAE
jgi:hypothetical protein